MLMYSQKQSTAMLVHSPKISTTVQMIARTRSQRSPLFASLFWGNFHNNNMARAILDLRFEQQGEANSLIPMEKW